MEHIYLSGADDVRQAGSRIAQAADEMKRAAGHIESALERFIMQLDERLNRLEEILPQPTAPLSTRCLVCGEDHGGVQCPRTIPGSGASA